MACEARLALGKERLERGPGGDISPPRFKPFPFRGNIFLRGQVEEK